RMLEPELKNLPVDVRSVSGTIWHGQVQAEQRDLGLLDAEWRLSPASLLVAAPEVDLTLTSPFVRLQGLARLGADQALHI
ncbi:type II secretion system protein N, partial [Wenyingzhuangia sp. 1_MG-2023]|nr:type II secretion system protein N [Wenyingzhuangia sp. 1_MG-2023]